MRILVTGGAGYIGSHTARHLAARGDDVVVLDSLLTGHRAAVGDLPLILGDIRDAELVFYCSNPMCRKAPLAAKRARDLGYANVRVLSAGIQGWLNASLPVESAAR